MGGEDSIPWTLPSPKICASGDTMIRGKLQFSFLLLVFGISLLLMGRYAAAALNPARPKILIVNSDGTVEKYRIARDNFQQEIEHFGGKVIDLDLRASDDGATIERIIGSESPDLIYSIGSKAYQLTSKVSREKPVLFSSVINWQRFGRNNNSYGVANELSMVQELSLMRLMLPGATRIGIIYNPLYSKERVAQARAEAAELGLQLIEQTVGNNDYLRRALDNLLPKIDVLWLIADPGILTDRQVVTQIFSAVEKYQKPIYAYSDAYLSLGASLVVAADTPTIGRQAANLAESILKHEKISDPVQTPAGSHITLNICQLGKLRARYNEDALDSVNQLLECQ